MTWNNYPQPILHNGKVYGAKELEFGRIASIPAHSPACFEVAINVNGAAPLDQWRQLGWSVIDAETISTSVNTYRTYIERSRGEFSVAKNIYVGTQCGWFSCRSVCYLAAGRPVVVQETGFSNAIPTGQGLFAFSTLNEAARAIATIEQDYPTHQAAARELARTYFDAHIVLSEILERIG
jgi:hypothetical protein